MRKRVKVKIFILITLALSAYIKLLGKSGDGKPIIYKIGETPISLPAKYKDSNGRFKELGGLLVAFIDFSNVKRAEEYVDVDLIKELVEEKLVLKLLFLAGIEEDIKKSYSKKNHKIEKVGDFYLETNLAFFKLWSLFKFKYTDKEINQGFKIFKDYKKANPNFELNELPGILWDKKITGEGGMRLLEANIPIIIQFIGEHNKHQIENVKNIQLTFEGINISGDNSEGIMGQKDLTFKDLDFSIKLSLLGEEISISLLSSSNEDVFQFLAQICDEKVLKQEKNEAKEQVDEDLSLETKTANDKTWFEENHIFLLVVGILMIIIGIGMFAYYQTYYLKNTK